MRRIRVLQHARQDGGEYFRRLGRSEAGGVEVVMELRTMDVVVLDFATGTMRIELQMLDADGAEKFCLGYNRDEDSQPSGLWAVAVPSTTTSTIKNRDSAALVRN